MKENMKVHQSIYTHEEERELDAVLEEIRDGNYQIKYTITQDVDGDIFKEHPDGTEELWIPETRNQDKKS